MLNFMTYLLLWTVFPLLILICESQHDECCWTVTDRHLPSCWLHWNQEPHGRSWRPIILATKHMFKVLYSTVQVSVPLSVINQNLGLTVALVWYVTSCIYSLSNKRASNASRLVVVKQMWDSNRDHQITTRTPP